MPFWDSRYRYGASRASFRNARNRFNFTNRRSYAPFGGINRMRRPFQSSVFRRPFGMRFRRPFIPKPEVKKTQGAIADATATAAGEIFFGSAVAQGLDKDERTGNTVRPLYYNCRFTVSNGDGAGNTEPAHVRVMFFQDTQQNAGVPIVASLLSNPSVHASLNADYVGRFKVIRDFHFALNSYVSATIPTIECSQFYQKFPRNMEPMKFFDVAGTNFSNGAIFVLWMTDNDSFGTLSLEWRLGYNDS